MFCHYASECQIPAIIQNSFVSRLDQAQNHFSPSLQYMPKTCENLKKMPQFQGYLLDHLISVLLENGCITLPQCSCLVFSV